MVGDSDFKTDGKAATSTGSSSSTPTSTSRSRSDLPSISPSQQSDPRVSQRHPAGNRPRTDHSLRKSDTRSRPLTLVEIRQGLKHGQVPFVLTTASLAQFLDVSKKTVDVWLAAGRLNGTFRKRGKHNIFLTERVLDVLFNGTGW